MYYQKYGKGPVLVLLHGFCENSSIWDQIIPSLSKSHKIITIDLPGFGKSNQLEAPTSLVKVAQQIHEFITLLDIEEYIIVGHSLGGYISLELVKLYPESILGVGMIHSTAFSDNQEKITIRKKTIDFVKKRGVKTFIKSFVPQLFLNKNAQDITTVINLAKSTPEQSLINYTIAMMERPDHIMVIKEWTKPFLFVAGEKDSIVTIEMSEKHLKNISKEHFYKLPNVGHMGMYEAPHDIIKLLKQFMQAC